MKLKGWFGFDSTFDLRTLACILNLDQVSRKILSLAAKKFININKSKGMFFPHFRQNLVE